MIESTAINKITQVAVSKVQWQPSYQSQSHVSSDLIEFDNTQLK